jgi:hypothetical protein
MSARPLALGDGELVAQVFGTHKTRRHYKEVAALWPLKFLDF